MPVLRNLLSAGALVVCCSGSRDTQPITTSLAPTENAVENLVELSVVEKAETEDISAADTGDSLTHVKLNKQYVPVMKNGVAVAYRTSYFGTVNVGTPFSTFSVVFDTGSGHLILPNYRCNSGPCLNHRRFNPKNSSTSVDVDHSGHTLASTATTRDQVAISFGTGKIVGEFAEDEVCVGDANKSTCSKLRIVLANQMTDDPFLSFKFDGVLGLGFEALTLHEKFSFFGVMRAQHPKMLPRFAAYLARSEGEGSSMITFGGHDERIAGSEIKWKEVTMPELGYWMIKIDRIRAGNTTLDDCEDGECRAICDTGTSLMGVPKMSIRNLQQRLSKPAPEVENLDCRTIAGEDLHFDLGEGFTLTLTPEEYLRPAPIMMKMNDTNETKPYCRAMLLPLDMKAPVGPKIFIFGEPFLRKYYTIYDWAEKKIGFTEAVHLPSSGFPFETGSAVDAPPAGTVVPGAPLRAVRVSTDGNGTASPPAASLVPGAPLPSRTMAPPTSAAATGDAVVVSV